VFENRALRRIFGHEREELAGGWRRLHNEEFRNLYSLPYIIRMIKRPLGRPKRRWEDDNRVDLKEICW
jgi:hypothetical protein